MNFIPIETILVNARTKFVKARIEGTDSFVVLKKAVNPQQNVLIRMEHEFYLFLGTHPYICPLIAYENGQLVLEWQRGDLLSWCGHLSEKWIQTMGFKIAQALAYCHSKNVCHGDIKAENILIQINFEPLLCDFGGSALFETLDSKLHLGFTRDYAAPEIYTNPTARCDFWAYGALLYEMYTKDLPYDELDTERLKFKGYTNKVSEEAQHLISSLLSQVPTERPVFNEVLKNSFFRNFTQ